MPSSRITRAATEARSQILASLKDDHKRVKKAYKEFQKLEDSQDPQAWAPIVEQVLDELTVHAALEEELLYPAAHGKIDDDSLLDEAEVEHESMHTLIDQLRALSPGDEKYAARFTVLCEYVMHHVKEEENEMFPQLEKARLDWESIAAAMDQRRQALTPQAEAEGDEEEALATPAPRAGGGGSAYSSQDEDAPLARRANAGAAAPSARKGGVRRSAPASANDT
jgi:hemerythrin superfamily protein